MINKRELRIGNIVEFENKTYKVHVLAEEFPTLDTIEFGIGVIDWNNLNPVLLTEERLLQLGFYKDLVRADKLNFGKTSFGYDIQVRSEAKVYSKKETDISVLDWFSRKKKDCWILRMGFIYLDKTEIEYVHQLQNLYFALTGEELTIN